jgi:hypothetical protein
MNATHKALANLVLAAAAILALNVAKAPTRFESKTRAVVTAAAR